ncbi:MAG: selenium metabolism-associated LysR family transcriptional regulator, partial [Syntrophomonadaceae bacterium]|nr:selenium metabolism-associated LysR family transcriptional regulator [Syntrophomonadaceae bacterium]
MRLNLFKTFVRVVECQNLSRVAEELRISQPAVSKQIQSLEDMYGVLLLERAGRQLRPTPAGYVLYQCARDILRELERTEQLMEEASESRKGNLRLGASTIPGSYILPALLKRFKESHPHVHVSMEIGDTEAIISRVAERELDCGVVGGWLNTRRVDGFRWMGDELVLVVPVDHRLAGEERVELSRLLHEPWIFRERGSGTRAAVEEGLRQAGIKPEELNMVAEVGSTDALLSVVEAGLGISLVSSWALRSASRAG